MSKKLIYLMSFVLVLVVTGTATPDQRTITIVNPGFEDPVLAEDGYTWLDVPGWTQVGGEGPGIWHVTSADFDPVVAPEGQNVLYTENAVGDAGGVAQVLTETFAANTDYTLTAEVGNSWYYYNGGYSVQLLAGGIVIAEDNDTLWPEYKTWATSTVAYTYDPADSALVGQPLEIRLLNLALDKDNPPAGEVVGVEFDNVTLSYLEVVHGAVYLWNGSAGDGNWDTPLNWTVTDSLWTWPNEEHGDKMVNDDTVRIDILNGDAVTRGSELAIQGAADGSTTGVLTLDNGSSLTVSGRLAISADPTMRGQIDILGGSYVAVVGDGNDLKVVDDPDTWGTLNIVDSTVDVADDLDIDQGEGYVNISGSSTVTCDDVIVANTDTCVGHLDISDTVTINADDLKTDDGEGHITISGSPTLNLDDLFISDVPSGLGFLDVSGTTTINIADDFGIEEGTGTVNIGGDATVNVGDNLYVAHDAGEGRLNISGNATVNIAGDMIIANAVGTTGYLHITDNPTINITGQFYMNDDGPDEGMPMVPSTSQVIMDGGTVTMPGYCTFNDDNNGTAEFILNGGSWYCADYLNLSDNLDGTAHLTMNGGEMITGNRLRLGKDGGEDTGQVRIFMNGGLLQAEELDIKITDTQIIYSGGEFRINKASLSEADMQQLITDGTIVPSGAYRITTDGDYTVLGPVPVVEIDIRIANSNDDVEERLREDRNGELDMSSSDLEFPYEDFPADDLQRVGLRFVNVPIPKGTRIAGAYIEFTVDGDKGGTSPVNVIIDGQLTPDAEPFVDTPFNVSNRPSWTTEVVKWSVPDWTEANVKFQTPDISALVQEIVDQEGWASGNAMVFTIQDDPDNPSIGVRESESYNGAIEDHSDVTRAPLLHITAIIDIATQPSPADGAEDVLIGSTLSWSPGAAAATHDVYFGTSSPPEFVGNQEAASYYPGRLETGTTYYWQIDEVEADGTTKHTGDIWSFTTGFGNFGANIRIAVENDDGEDHIAYGDQADDGAESRGSSDLEMPWEGGVQSSSLQVIGLRLAGIPIPKGVLITDAYVQFTGDDDDDEKLVGGPVNLIINGLLQPDPDEFGSGENFYTDRNPKTTAEVNWTDIPEWSNRQATPASKTPDISSIIQEIIGQDDWSSGNALMLFFRDDETNPSAATRSALSGGQASGTEPLLHITAISEIATQPHPANGAENVPLDTILSWWPGFSAVSHDGYIGFSSPPPFLGNTPEVSFDPGGLQPGTTYYWQLNAVEADGTTHVGDIWSFTTAPEVEP